MAHFLEHLVFKGGEKYPTYKDVNETAERLGRRAERLHQPRPRRLPHHRPRRERAAGDRPAQRLRRPAAARRRGARPRARRRDPGDQPRLRPALDGGRVPDRPGGLRRAPARAHRCSAPRRTCAASRREGDHRLPRAPLGRAPRRRVPRRQPRPPAPERGAARALFGRFPALPEPEPYVPAPAFAPADPRRGARDQPVAPAHDLPARRRRSPTLRRAGRAGDLLDAARRLDGLAPVRGDPREARPVLLGLRDRPRLRRRADPAARLGPGVGASASRPTRACARSSTNCAARARPSEEVERARAYAAGRLRAGVRELRRRRPPRRHPADRVRRGHRPRRGDRGARRRHLRRGRARSPRASARSSPSPASARTRPTNSEQAAAAAAGGRLSRSRPCGRSARGRARRVLAAPAPRTHVRAASRAAWAA